MNALSPEDLRRLAFDGVYLLHAPMDRHDAPAAGTKERLEQLPIEQRDRALRMAARRLAFQVLYELDLGSAGGKLNDAAADMVAKSLGGVENLGPLAMEEVKAMVLGAFRARQAADDEFGALAPEWPAYRQPAVDRAILRLAHFEMTSGKTPPKIVVDEAIELAKHYSTEKSPPFINGLLDPILRRMEGSAGGSVLPIPDEHQEASPPAS